MQETLAVSIERISDDTFEKQNLNEHETGIKLERI
jgi:isoleucyl-tRNA synthetase